jgi:hypothetical protein
MMKLINYSVAVLFATFVAVQFNDPDALLWVFLYGTPIVIAVFAAYHRLHRGVIWTALAICFVVMAFVTPGLIQFIGSDIGIAQAMSDQRPYVEQTREFFGMTIVAAYYLGLLILAPRPVEAETKSAQTDEKLQSRC